MKTAVIIGGGPAGCQTALWLRMLGFDPLIIEKNNCLGGLQVLNPYLNNWMIGTIGLNGNEFAENIEKHIHQLNIPVLFNTTVNAIKKTSQGFEVTVKDKKINTHYVVIATGVNPGQGEFIAAENVLIGPGKKIAEFDFTNKKIAILGGGDNAAENYTFIKNKQPKECHIYARTIKARHSLWQPVHLIDVFQGNYLANQSKMQITHQEQINTYDVFIVLYGWQANIPNALESFTENFLNEKKFLMVNEKRETKIQGIYAAGEVTHILHPCVTTSMADGVMVAKSIEFELARKENLQTL